MTPEERLAALKARFVARSAEEVEALETALAEGDFERIGAVSHSLAGSAGLFGFPQISAAAGDIDTLYATGEEPTEAQVRDLIAMVRAIQKLG